MIVSLIFFTHITVGYTYLLRAWAPLVSSVAFLFVGISVKLFFFDLICPLAVSGKIHLYSKKIHAFV